MGKTRRNEQRKLAASFVNGCALAVMAAGVVVPVAQFAGTRFGWLALAGALAVAACLAALARHMLGGLEDDASGS
jgi:cobalamin synthase